MGRSKSLDKKEVEIGSSDDTMDIEKENPEKNSKRLLNHLSLQCDVNLNLIFQEYLIE